MMTRSEITLFKLEYEMHNIHYIHLCYVGICMILGHTAYLFKVVFKGIINKQLADVIAEQTSFRNGISRFSIFAFYLRTTVNTTKTLFSPTSDGIWLNLVCRVYGNIMSQPCVKEKYQLFL